MGVRWFRRQQEKVGCDCHAEKTFVSPVFVFVRGRPPQRKRAQMVFHVADSRRFWHWSDQTNVITECDWW